MVIVGVSATDTRANVCAWEGTVIVVAMWVVQDVLSAAVSIRPPATTVTAVYRSTTIDDGDQRPSVTHISVNVRFTRNCIDKKPSCR